MQAHIFKSRKNPDMYLFVREGQDMDELDQMVRERLGELEFVMALDLSEDRPLARTDSTIVRDHIEKLGFHLQLPPSAENWAHWDNLKAGIRAGRPQSE